MRIQGSSPTRRPPVEKNTRAPVEEPQRGSEEEEPEYGFIRTSNNYRPSNHKTTEVSAVFKLLTCIYNLTRFL